MSLGASWGTVSSSQWTFVLCWVQAKYPATKKVDMPCSIVCQHAKYFKYVSNSQNEQLCSDVPNFYMATSSFKMPQGFARRSPSSRLVWFHIVGVTRGGKEHKLIVIIAGAVCRKRVWNTRIACVLQPSRAARRHADKCSCCFIDCVRTVLVAGE